MSDIKIDKAIKSYLLDFGLTDKEIIVYVSLLKSGPSSIMNIARKTGIKRSTCHNYVEELISKGLVSQTNYGERRMVVAEDPEKLKFLLEQRKWDLAKLEKNMPDVLSTISALIPNAEDNSSVDVKYYVGKQQIKYIYNMILKSNLVHSFVNVDKVRAIMPENFALFEKAFKNNKKLVILEIVEDNGEKKHSDEVFSTDRYEVKNLPPGRSLSDVDIMVFDNNIALVDLKEENSSAILINSMQLAESLRSIHQIIWEML
jgi:sugar-specific transcriptional regulator TrmB